MRAFKTKTAADPLPDEAYAKDGLSVFTHRAAKSKQPRPAAAARSQSVRTLIEIQEHGLRKLFAEHRATSETDPRIAVIRRNIDIKQVFIEKLYAELGDAMRRGKA
jgi:hypothetical protein